MIRADFRSFGAGDIHLSRPLAVRTAEALPGVIPLIDWAENSARRGLWVALLLSYESAAALDPGLVARRPSEFPLAWAAAFAAPTKPPSSAGRFAHGPWAPGLKKDRYLSAINKIKGRIARGDTYQVNFTFPLACRWSGNPWAWYSRLAAGRGEGPSAFLDFGRWKVASLSPELFFDRTPGKIVMRPMKGSAPRGLWPGQDRAFARALQQSPKDRAENLMIVDLIRNDLGKIARTGSVKTKSLFDVESYPSVHQMTSTVSAGVSPSLSLADTLRALFPSGSVTGAPKRRTMEIIRDLEGAPRGVYTGTIGLLRPNGRWTFTVAIRTLTLDADTGRAVCPVGSGVTWSSRPTAEYEECLLKSRFLTPSPLADPLETLRLENGRWFLLEDHLTRLRSTAGRFDRPLNMPAVRDALRRTRAIHPRGIWKVRLTAPPGAPAVTVTPLKSQTLPWRVAISRRPMDESDPFLYHKTTKRDMYDSRRRDRPNADDVLLINARGELTESTVANLVVKMKGRLFTPPVSSGLLPGVFRGYLLRTGKISERIIRREDLARADRVFLINSVRRWIPATIVR